MYLRKVLILGFPYFVLFFTSNMIMLPILTKRTYVMIEGEVPEVLTGNIKKFRNCVVIAPLQRIFRAMNGDTHRL